MESVDIEKLKRGMRLRLANPHWGMHSDKILANGLVEKYGPDHVYVVKKYEIHSWITYIQFEGIKGEFNSVHFVEETEDNSDGYS